MFSSRVGGPALRRLAPKRWVALGVAAAFAAGLTAVVGIAGNGDETGGVNVSRFAKVDPSLLAAAKGFVPAALSNKPVTVMLQMAGDPVAVQQVAAAKQGKNLSKAEKAAIRAQLKSKQDALTGSIAAAGARIEGQLQSAYNGVQVTVAQKNISQLASLPGVVAVRAVRAFRPSNVHGVAYVGAPTAWGTYSRTGLGVKLAVIDTGIDYTHADFGGPGTPGDFAAASKTSDGPADPSMFGPAAPKVKGGQDFVGDDYNADPASPKHQPVPHPDPNPLDCNGHGSHTAGTAAGFGVLANGHTYHGTYGANTVSSQDWNVGPGVAPQADIYAYRVFGCAGSSDIVDLAIDQAVTDNVDVISMSLGSDFGGQDDPTTVAAENAAALGIAVVASAGNAGPAGYIVGSPSTGNHVLSVAALDASVPAYPGAKLNLSTGSTVDTIVANGAALPAGTFGVKVLRNADGSIATGCDPAAYGDATGKIVVTKRGTCARVARAIFGQQANAAAVVMVNNTGTLPPFEGPITSNPDTGSPYTVTIPFLGAAGTAANTTALINADGGTTTLSSFSIANSGYQQVASFSSGGPRNPDSAPKPDVIAPGVSVASVGIGTGDGFAFISGTSMACPMTAGIAALVKQAHHDWSATQVKAAIQNTADPSLNLGYNVRLAGAGVVQAQKAVDSTVLATTADGLNSIAFGHVPGSGSYTATKTITLTNTGPLGVTYALSVDTGDTDQRGASVTALPSSVPVAAGGEATVTVTLTIPSGAFTALPSNDTFVVGPGGVRTVRGAIVATPTAGSHVQTLRVPYLVAPRGLSNVSVASVAGSNGKYSANVTNTGVHAGNADVYAWGLNDASGEPTAAGDSVDMRDVGVQVVDGKVLGGKSGDTGMNFLISNNNGTATQAVNEYDVLIDTNGDGVWDYDVFAADLGAVTTGSFDGIVASFIYDIKNNVLVDAWYAEAPMNSSIVELPFLASEIGLKPGHARFTYTVVSQSLVTGAVDTTGTGVFDAHSLPVSTGDFVAVGPGAGASIPLTVNAGQLAQTPVKGWLFATVDDATGASQADEVPLP